MSEELDEWWNGLTPATEVAGLRAQLETVTADRDGLTLELDHLRPEWQAVTAERDAAIARAEAAEAQALQLRLGLGAAVERANRLAIWADRYGADQWRRGNAGKEPQEFEEWQRE